MCKGAEICEGVTCGRGQTTLTCNYSNPLAYILCFILVLFVILLLPVDNVCLVGNLKMIPKNQGIKVELENIPI